MMRSGGPRCTRGGRQHHGRRFREPLVDPAWSEIHGMYGTSMCENREIPLSPRLLITGWAAQGTQGGTPEMHERGKSDRFVVPANPPNKATAAEVGEERERAKGNTVSKTHPGPSAGTDASSALGRVREVARRDKDARFTALLHHVRRLGSGGRIGRSARRPRRGWTG